MRILFIFNQLLIEKLSSGGDVKAYDIYQRFVESKNHNIEVIAPNVATSLFLDANKVHITNTNFIASKLRHTFVPFILLLYKIRTLESLKFINKIDTDCIYTTGDFFCNVIPAYLFKLKNIRRTNNSNNSPSNEITKKKIKWVACIYHINENPFKRTSNYFLRSSISYVTQRFSFLIIKKHADTIFVLSQGMKQELINFGFNNEIVISYAGLDIKSITTLFPNPYNLRKTNDLLFLNRVNPTKGVLDLPYIMSKVINKYPDTNLHIIGNLDESMRIKLEEEFKTVKCINNVKIYGFMESKENALKLLSTCKVFLQPSYEEGWSIVLFEAILSGTIPVVYDLPVYSEIFGENISKVKKGHKKAFSEKIIEIMGIDPENYNDKLKPLYDTATKYDLDNVYQIENQVIIRND